MTAASPSNVTAHGDDDETLARRFGTARAQRTLFSAMVVASA